MIKKQSISNKVVLIFQKLMLHNFSYEPEMDQIEALISVSEYCEQEVINNCTSNSLTGFAWWLDRNGDKYQYWHGDRNDTAVGKGLKTAIIPKFTNCLKSQKISNSKRMPMFVDKFMRLCFQ